MKIIESLKKGLGILESFSSTQPRLKLQELIRKTGLPKATVYRLLRTLMTLNYVRFDDETAEYYLGPRVMALGFTVLVSQNLRERALPYLEELSRKTDQNVNLVILDNTDVVFIESIKKKQGVTIGLSVGSRISAHNTSTGRAILAYLDDVEMDAMLTELLKDPETARQIGPHGKDLLEVLSRVRAKGYALNDGELLTGLLAVGAPVFDNRGKVVAAISTAVFKQLCTKEHLIEHHVPLLLETARDISAACGFVNKENSLVS